MGKRNAQDNDVRKDFQRMKDDLKALKEKRQRVMEMIGGPDLLPVLGWFEKQIVDLKESLVRVDKKDLEKMQAQIHALLLQGGKESADAETGEVLSA